MMGPDGNVRPFFVLAPVRVLLALLPLPVAAQDLPQLAWPVACTLGETCYIQNLVDRDPGPGARDVTCESRTYDGHTGTDIALPTLADQAAGVDVFATLPGTVVALRDGMEDRLQPRDGTGPDIAGRECGNGVLLHHDGGWESQYCHMAQGSLTVAEGDTVAAGDPLGLVGLSGNTEFPHLHLVIRRDGEVIDPFDPDGSWACGEEPSPALWAAPLPEGRLIGAGLSNGVPTFDAITAGEVDLPPTRTTPLVLWAYFHGTRAGDVIRLAISDGTDVLFETDEIQESPLARGFRAGGRRAPEGGWPAGRYLGTALLLRNGAVLDRAETEVILD